MVVAKQLQRKAGAEEEEAVVVEVVLVVNANEIDVAPVDDTMLLVSGVVAVEAVVGLVAAEVVEVANVPWADVVQLMIQDP